MKRVTAMLHHHCWRNVCCV